MIAPAGRRSTSSPSPGRRWATGRSPSQGHGANTRPCMSSMSCRPGGSTCSICSAPSCRRAGRCRWRSRATTCSRPSCCTRSEQASPANRFFFTTSCSPGTVRLTPYFASRQHWRSPIRRWTDRRWRGVVEIHGAVGATGGILFHYNRPYGDIYMDVAEPFRRRGLGSFLVQELKRVCYEGGHVPAARCNTGNIASQRTLQKAGFVPCGHILKGFLKAPDARGGRTQQDAG